MAGYVYLIGNPIFKWYKIGKSVSPEVRVQELGILLPFKLTVIGVWKAADHSLLESELHARYEYCRINGEWFRFEHDEIYHLFRLLPKTACVYPLETMPNQTLEKFSNIEEDKRGGRRIIGVRTQKLRGNFTPEEREQKRQTAIEMQKHKKQLREVQ